VSFGRGGLLGRGEAVAPAVVCVRCGLIVKPLHGRYGIVLFGERGASRLGRSGNQHFGDGFHTGKVTDQYCLCGPCYEDFLDVQAKFLAGMGSDGVGTFEFQRAQARGDRHVDGSGLVPVSEVLKRLMRR